MRQTDRKSIHWGALLLAAIAAGAAVARLLRPDATLLGLAATHLPPAATAPLLVAAAAPALAALVSSAGRRAGLVVAGAVAVTLVATAFREDLPRGGADPAAGPPELVAVTYNVEKWAFPPGEIAGRFAASPPDVLCLAEAGDYDWRPPRAGVDALLRGLPGYVAIGAGEVRLVTRWPVRSWEELPLPPGPPGRPALRAVLDGPAGPLTVLVAHLVPTLPHLAYAADRGDAADGGVAAVAAVRQAQVARLLALPVEGPTLLCGDLNAAPFWPPVTALRARFDDPWLAVGEGRGATAPVEAPRVRIDYLLTRGLTATAMRVRDDIFTSDHFPVEGRFRFVRGK